MDDGDGHGPEDDGPDLDASGELLAALSDEELEAELTIAAGNRGLDERYQALLAERRRRRRRDG
jgi:hypothetical protein